MFQINKFGDMTVISFVLLFKGINIWEGWGGVGDHAPLLSN